MGFVSSPVDAAENVGDLVDIVDDRIGLDTFMERGTSVAVAAGNLAVLPFALAGSGSLFSFTVTTSEMGVGMTIGTNEIETTNIEMRLKIQKATLEAVEDLIESNPNDVLDVGSLNDVLAQGGVPSDLAIKTIQLVAEHNYDVTGVIGDGWPGDNVIGDGYYYDYTLDNENPASATYDENGNVLTSSRPVARPEDGGGFLDWVGDVTGLWPIILDLDGDGVEISNSASIQFDVDDDGYTENAFWAGPDDGFLVIDLNADGTRGAGDGVIDQVNEIAFSLWGDDGWTDLEALANATDDQGNLIFDTNADGVLSISDASWAEFKIWQDENQNGITDEGELHTLSDLGISSINLGYDENSELLDAFGTTILGNTFHGFGSYVRDGEVVVDGVADVTLAYEANGWKNVETAEGFDILYEDGVKYSSWEMEKHTTANANLVAEGLVGARGDARDNSLSAENADYAVSIAGGAGNDILVGGNKVDFLHGGTGSDVMRGGLGDDVYLFELGDGQTVIDDTVFSIQNGSATILQTGSDGMSVQEIPPAGKDMFGREKWVSDTHSGATVQIIDGGTDTLVFGENIGISDLSWETDGPNTFLTDPNLDRNLEITIENGFDNDDQFNSITIENWGSGGSGNIGGQEGRLEILQFENGKTIEVGGALGDAYTNGITGSNSNDILSSMTTSNYGVTTDTGNAWINGLAGDDTISGGSGGDIIIGGAGNDIMTGSQLGDQSYGVWDNAVDKFVFANNHGQDTITDFKLGTDKILYDIESLDREQVTLSDTDNGMIITLADGSSITMPTITVAEFEEAEEQQAIIEFWG